MLTRLHPTLARAWALLPYQRVPEHPHLQLHAPDAPVRAVALVLHGGRVRSEHAVPPWSLALVRMIPFTRSLRQAGRGQGLAVAQLRFRVRGWNGDNRSPVSDARWALEQIRSHYGDVPVGLVGHSMGGRTVLAVADDPSVRSVVALAPWVESNDPTETVAGRHLLVLHGDRDRTTSPAAAARLVDSVQGLATTASFVRVRNEGHAMLRRAGIWHQLATDYTLSELGLDPETRMKDTTNTLGKALAGVQASEI